MRFFEKFSNVDRMTKPYLHRTSITKGPNVI